MTDAATNQGPAKPTICFQCKHHRTIDTNPAYPDIWHGQYCTLCEIPKVLDFVTGEMTRWQQYKYCRDVNRDGRCLQWEKKR